MSTHEAIQMVAKRAPLQSAQVPTVQPEDGEVLVKVQWVASTPLDLHQLDGGLTNFPNIPGDSIAGVVTKIGTNVKNLQVGDRVFGFGWRTQKEKAAQEYATFHQDLLGKIPNNIPSRAAVTLPNNFVTVFHAFTKDLDLSLPWPKPSTPPPHASTPILIWGASSSVGFFALQILKYYGFTNLIGTASKQHHPELLSLGASAVFDYREKDVVQKILSSISASGSGTGPAIPLILDCIGSKSGSLAPISQLAQAGSKVAILLPVILRDATETVEPLYTFDPVPEAEWAEGVRVRGVRTHFYLENEMYKELLQPVIMPTLLEQGVVLPNRQRVVEGNSLLERAQGAVDMLRRKEVSGERLVWRVCDE